jgi:hypothetical protein
LIHRCYLFLSQYFTPDNKTTYYHMICMIKILTELQMYLSRRAAGIITSDKDIKDVKPTLFSLNTQRIKEYTNMQDFMKSQTLDSVCSFYKQLTSKSEIDFMYRILSAIRKMWIEAEFDPLVHVFTFRLNNVDFNLQMCEVVLG